MLFNCAPPEVISEALAILRPLYSGKIGGYGNRLGMRKSYGVKDAHAQSATIKKNAHKRLTKSATLPAGGYW